MDDLIVIILTLIIAGIGVLGQIRKKKQQSPMASESEGEQESIWDLIQNEIREPELVPEIRINEEETKKVEDPLQYQSSTFDSKMEGVSVVQKKPTEIITEKDGKGLKEKFSLRKAVIYSEILNRKYI